LKAVLYKDGVATASEIILVTGINNGKSFTGLLSDIDYTVQIVVDYDLNDGTAVKTGELLDTLALTTDLKVIPTATLSNKTTTASSITFDVNVVDSTSSITGNLKAVLYKDGVATASEIVLIVGDNLGKSFSGLVSSGSYEVKIVTDYDINDGSGEKAAEELANYVTHTTVLVAPTAVISDVTITKDAITFDVNVVDDDNTSTGNTVAVLYKGGVATASEIILSDGINDNQSFTGLLSNNDYEVKIITDYNLLDGAGSHAEEVLDNEAFTTIAYSLPTTVVDDLTITVDTIEFKFNYDDVDSVLSSGTLKASLWVAGVKISEKGIATDTISFDISSMIADFDFTVKITGDYNVHDGAGLVDDGVIFEEEFTTLAYTAPTAIIQDVIVNQYNVEMDVKITDDDDKITGNLKAVLYDKDDVILETIALSVGENSIIFAQQINSVEVYEIVIYSDYDLLDAQGVHSSIVLQEYVFIEMNKFVPQPVFSNIVLTTTSITFDVYVYDRDSTYDSNLTAVLYQDGQPTGDTSGLSLGANIGEAFTGLDSNSDYTVVIIADYNIDDGNGNRLAERIGYITQHTVAKVVPTATVSNERNDYDSITFDVTVVDDDSTITGNLKAILYKDGVYDDELALIVGVNSNKSFTGLLSDMDYTIKIVTDYDLNDNEGIVAAELLDNFSVATDTKTAPKATMGSKTVTATSITFDVDVYDSDNTYVTNLKAVLYKNGVFQDELALVLGANPSKSFTGLDSDTYYVIKVVSDNNLSDGAGVVTNELSNYTFTTLIKEVPTSTIENKTVYDTEIIFDVIVVDDDSAISGNAKAVLYQGGAATGDEIVITAGNNTSLSFDGLDFGEDYTIKVITDYKLSAGSSEVLAFEMASDDSTTHQVIVISEDDVDIQKEKVIFELSTDDMFSILTSNQIALQLYDKDDIAIGDTITINQNSGVVLLNLYADNDYYVEFSPTYDLGAGDVTEVVFTYSFHTLPMERPEIVIDRDTIVVAATTIDLDVNVGADPDSVVTGALNAYIYADGDTTVVIQTISLTLGTGVNSIQFTGLDTANHSYQILIRADSDFNDGVGTVTLHTYDEVTFIEGN